MVDAAAIRVDLNRFMRQSIYSSSKEGYKYKEPDRLAELPKVVKECAGGKSLGAICPHNIANIEAHEAVWFMALSGSHHTRIALQRHHFVQVFIKLRLEVIAPGRDVAILVEEGERLGFDELFCHIADTIRVFD